METSHLDEKEDIIGEDVSERLSVLTRLSSIINSSLYIEKVLEQSMRCVEEVMNVEASSIFELDRKREELFFRLARGKKGDKAKEIRLKMGEGIIGWVARTGKHAIIYDASRDERFSQRVDMATGFVTRSVLCVPLKVKGEVVGALQVLNKKDNSPFTESDALFLTSFSDQVALALNNAKLYEEISTLNRSLKRKIKEIRERNREYSLLLETSTTISSTLELNQLLETLAEKMARKVVTTFCRIFFLDGEEKNLVVQAAYPTRDLAWEPEIGKLFPLNSSTIVKRVVNTKRSLTLYGSRLERVIGKDSEERLLTGHLKNLQSILLVPLVFKDRVLGIASLGEVRKWDRSPFDSRKIKLCKAIANQAAVAIEHAKLFEEVKNKNKELKETYFESLKVLAQSIEEKERYTRAHSERMVRYALLLGEKLGLPTDLREPLKYSAILHDIGKIDIPREILGKTSPLSESEFKIIQTHPLRGAKLIESIKFLSPVVPIILHHHERWDGSGYPKGLKGEKIPIGARIICIVDAYDAMTSDRPYQRSKGKTWAIYELKRLAGKQFDPEVVDAFLEILKAEQKGEL